MGVNIGKGTVNRVANKMGVDANNIKIDTNTISKVEDIVNAAKDDSEVLNEINKDLKVFNVQITNEQLAAVSRLLGRR